MKQGKRNRVENEADASGEPYDAERSEHRRLTDGYARVDRILRAIQPLHTEEAGRVAVESNSWAPVKQVAAAAAIFVAAFTLFHAPTNVSSPSYPKQRLAAAVNDALEAFEDELQEPDAWELMPATVALDLVSCVVIGDRNRGSHDDDQAGGQPHPGTARTQFLDGLRNAPEALRDVLTQRIASQIVAPPEDPRVALIVSNSLTNDPANAASWHDPNFDAWLDLARPSQSVRLRVIDLDREREIDAGLDVYAQIADLRTGELGNPFSIGTTPVLRPLPPGDVRLTVVDVARRRHAELRLLVLPNMPIEPRLAFIRSKPIGGEMVPVPGGYGTYGVEQGEAILDVARRVHHPATLSTVEAFRMDRFEVSNRDYQAFHLATELHPEWFEGGFEACRPSPPNRVQDGTLGRAGKNPLDDTRQDLPVVGISWHDAVLYANWVGKRLPTDREWEFAARGVRARAYPWGDHFDPGRVPPRGSVFSTRSSHPDELWRQGGTETGGLGPVGAYPVGGTPEGVERLADNAREWVEDIFSIPAVSGSGYRYSDLPRGVGGFGFLRCARGASWTCVSPDSCLTSCARAGYVPENGLDELGFRCVATAFPRFALTDDRK